MIRHKFLLTLFFSNEKTISFCFANMVIEADGDYVSEAGIGVVKSAALKQKPEYGSVTVTNIYKMEPVGEKKQGA